MMILGSAAAAQFMVSLLVVGVALVLLRHQNPVLINRGMSEQEVEAALGTPGRRSRADRRATWVYADRQDHRAVITFRSGRVERVRYE